MLPRFSGGWSVPPTEGNFLQFVRAICATSDNKRHQFRRRHGHSTCFRPAGGRPRWRAAGGGRRAVCRRRRRDGASVHRRDATTPHVDITQLVRRSVISLDESKKKQDCISFKTSGDMQCHLWRHNHALIKPQVR